MNTPASFQDVSLPFSSIERHKFEVQFSEEDTSSDGGLILLREVEKQTGHIENFSNSLIDSRNQSISIPEIDSMESFSVFNPF